MRPARLEFSFVPKRNCRERGPLQSGRAFHSVLDEKMDIMVGRAALSTMHIAKGLEFRTVVVMACDDDIIPLQRRIETATDQSEL